MKRPTFVFSVLYAAAALVLLDQASELVVSLAPFRWSDLQWRFGAFGLAIGRSTALILVDTLVLLAATAREDRRVLRGVAVLHFLLAGVILAWLGLFGLDFLELRRTVEPTAQSRVLFPAVRAMAIGLLLAALSVALGFGLFAATRYLEPRGRPKRESGADDLLVAGKPKAGSR